MPRVIVGGGLPEGLREMLSGEMSTQERNRFKADIDNLHAWKDMLALETTPLGIVLYAKMIDSSNEDGADVQGFVEAVVERYLEVIEGDKKRELLEKIGLLSREFRLEAANNYYLLRAIEHFAPFPPSVAFYIYAQVRADGFGGREVKDALYESMPEHLRVPFDIYAQSI